MVNLRKILLPKSLDEEINRKLEELKSTEPFLDFSTRFPSQVSHATEVIFALYGGLKENVVKVNDWSFLGYKKVGCDSTTYNSSVIKDMKKLVGSLHSHPGRLCKFRGKYTGKCNPTPENCFSARDLVGSALVYNILLSSDNYEKDFFISIVYCVPEERYVGLSYPGQKITPVELYRD